MSVGAASPSMRNQPTYAASAWTSSLRVPLTLRHTARKRKLALPKENAKRRGREAATGAIARRRRLRVEEVPRLVARRVDVVFAEGGALAPLRELPRGRLED